MEEVNVQWKESLRESTRRLLGGRAYPAGGESIPLGGGVGDMEDPKEAFTHVAATGCDGVHLEDAGLAGFFEGAGAGGDLGRERGLAAGAFLGVH